MSLHEQDQLVTRFLELYVQPQDRNLARVILAGIVDECVERARTADMRAPSITSEADTVPRMLAAHAVALCLVLSGCATNTIPPEQAAQKFVEDLGVTIKGHPSCAQVDTDNDGYVTCTVNRSDGNLLSIQCAALNDPTGCTPGKSSAYAVGCKMSPLLKAPGSP